MARPSWDAEPRRPERPSTPNPPASKPANPTSPTPPGSAQASAGEQYGGFTGTRKDESTYGGANYEKDWDPQWEKRVNRLSWKDRYTVLD